MATTLFRAVSLASRVASTAATRPLLALPPVIGSTASRYFATQAAAAVSVTVPPNVTFVNTTPEKVMSAITSPPPSYATEIVKTVPVLSFNNASVVGSVTLDNRVFGVKLRQDFVHRVIRWQLAKRRMTAYKTKGRDETRGGGRKPHPQKHTGNARAGSIRDAHWRGGNRAPAIVLRDWSIGLQRKVRRAGLRVALSSKYHDRRLFVIADPVVESFKTKEVLAQLQQHGWSDNVLVIYGSNGIDPNLYLGCRNVHGIRFLAQRGANVYDIVKYDNLVLTETAVKELTDRLAPEH